MKSLNFAYNPRIDQLRWLAATLVFCFHFYLEYRGLGGAPLLSQARFGLMSQGLTGVGLFFTLSGFLFMQIAQRQRAIVYREFLRNRLSNPIDRGRVRRPLIPGDVRIPPAPFELQVNAPEKLRASQVNLISDLFKRRRQPPPVGDKLPVHFARGRLIAAKLREGPTDLEPVRRRTPSAGRPIVAPRPTSRGFDNSRSNGIQDHIAAQLQQMRIAFDENRFVPPLKEVSASTMTEVEPLGVPAIQPLHPRGEIAPRGLEQQMVVVPHQAVRMEPPELIADHSPENRKESIAISIIAKDRRALVSPTRHMINSTFVLKPQRSRHHLSI